MGSTVTMTVFISLSSVLRTYCEMNFIGQRDCGISIEFALQQMWNLHLAGLMYCFILPEVSNTRNCIADVDFDELELAKERCCYRPPQSGRSDEFTELAGIIMRENNLQFPRTAKQAAILYVSLLEEIEAPAKCMYASACEMYVSNNMYAA